MAAKTEKKQIADADRTPDIPEIVTHVVASHGIVPTFEPYDTCAERIDKAATEAAQAGGQCFVEFTTIFGLRVSIDAVTVQTIMERAFDLGEVQDLESKTRLRAYWAQLCEAAD